MTAKERENLMKKVKPLENKLSNNKKRPGNNNKKQKKCTQWTVEVDRLRTALDNRVGGPCEQSKSEKWCAKKKCGNPGAIRPSFCQLHVRDHMCAFPRAVPYPPPTVVVTCCGHAGCCCATVGGVRAVSLC